MAVAAQLFACSESGGDGRPVSPPEEKRLYGYFVDESGIPSIGASVRLYRGTYLRTFDQDTDRSVAVLIGETRTNPNGSYVIADPGGGNFYLEALSADGKGMAIVDSVGRDGRGFWTYMDTLKRIVSIQGMVNPADSVKSLHLAGTHHVAYPDSAGAFRFPALPAGPMLFVVKIGAGASARNVGVRALRPASAQALDLGTVHLAGRYPGPFLWSLTRLGLWDFEDFTGRNLLRGTLFPASLPESDMSGSWEPRDNMPRFSGAALNGIYSLDMNRTDEEQGFRFAGGYVSLSRMKAFHFAARGKGRVIVRVRSALSQAGYGDFEAAVDLLDVQDGMPPFFILPENFLPPRGSRLAREGIMFEDVRDRILGAYFAKEGEVTGFYVDAISLIGTTAADLLETPVIAP